MSELKPCIHCGSPMEFYIRDKSFMDSKGKWLTGWESGVNCTDEYCSLYILYGWAGGGMIVEDVENFVAKKWNTRADGWISVEERLPEKMVQVLTVTNKGSRSVDYLLTDTLWNSINNFHMMMMDYELEDDEIPRVIYWQPLPPPPTD